MSFVSLNSVFAISGTLFNSAIVYLFIYKKDYCKKKPNKFVISLTVSCLIQTAVIAPYRMLRLVRSKDALQCKVNNIELVNCLMTVSGVYNAVIAYDRYHYIIHKLTYSDLMRGGRYISLIIAPWISAAVFMLTVPFGHLSRILFVLALMITLYCIFITFYGKLIKELVAQYNDHHVAVATRKVRYLRNKKVINLVIIVISVNMGFSLPGFFEHVVGFVHEIVEPSWSFWNDYNALIDESAHLFHLMTASTNALFFLYRNKPFRKLMSKYFRHRPKIAPAPHPALYNVHPKTRFRTYPENPLP